MIYHIAEKFKSIQGEGVYAGTPMAFIRFVGCSVGKTVCVACDTDFEQMIPWRGGGEFDEHSLLTWIDNHLHVCLTGGEPLDQTLPPLIDLLQQHEIMVHVETSGTKNLGASTALASVVDRAMLWVCVSPKPGFIEEVVMAADEVKVIMPGLGVLKHGVVQPASRRGDSHAMAEAIKRGGSLHEDGTIRLPWPTLQDALRWANAGKTVFIQPRNGKFDVDQGNLRLCQDIVAEYPQLRLSVQLHKVLRVQ